MGRHVKTQEDLVQSTLADITKVIEAHLAARSGDEPTPLLGEWILSVSSSLPTDTDPIGNPVMIVLSRESTTYERAFQLAVGAASMTRRAASLNHAPHECGPECGA